MTVDEIKARINLLSDEIDANEEENARYWKEINELYEILDSAYWENKGE